MKFKDKNINILYIYVSLPIGGAEQLLLTSLMNMDLNRYRPIVCCIRDKGKIGEEIESLGFELIELGNFSKSFNIFICFRIIKIIHKYKIDIIHTHLYHSNLYGRLAAIMTGVPVVATEHNVYQTYKFKRRVINWLLAKKTHKVIAVSGMVRDYITKRDWLDPLKIELIHNGIDLNGQSSLLTREEARDRLRIPRDAFVVGTVGRLTDQKGHIFLVNAAKRLKDAIANLRVIIVGAGPLLPNLKKAIEEESLEECVLLLGSRRDIPEILRTFDVFAFPSLWEGLPLSLLEAMSCSIPVVATPAGGVVEIITDGVNGLTVPFSDAGALADSILYLHENAGFRKELGEKGLAVVQERFSASSMMHHMETLYETMLNSSRSFAS